MTAKKKKSKPARPPQPRHPEGRQHIVLFRVTEKELARLTKVAKKNGQSVSTAVRVLVFGDAA